MDLIVKKLVPVTTYKEEEVEAILPAYVFPVQFRNYSETIHIQGTTAKANRDYGFSFDIHGQANEDESLRVLPSKAGTGQMYWNGTLVIEEIDGEVTQAYLLATSGNVYDATNITTINTPGIESLVDLL